MKNKKIPVTRLIVIFALLWLPRTKATMSLKYACIGLLKIFLFSKESPKRSQMSW